MASAQEASNGDGRRRPLGRRVLVFPLPFQGHINPMLQLADVLHSRGLAITVLHTRFNALDPALHPQFTFVAVPDGIPADVAASGSVISIILAMNAAMEEPGPVRDALASVLGEKGKPTAACLFIDANLLAVQKAATALGLPTMVLRSASAACFSCFLAYPMLHQNGYLPPKESQLYTPVKELPPLRVRDLFFSSSSNHEMMRKVLARATEAAMNSKALVINTFDALEPAELDRIRRELDGAVVLAVGPLHKLSTRSTGSSLLREDRSCIEWLDTQPTGSVLLYVSFGSLASMDAAELLEVAWGLANSGQPFLWVVRRDLVRGSDGSELPEGFGLAVEGRSKVIQWAPQQEVLAHPSVGGFWTHNGWNSTLESISEGLPMICRPQFADQMMNTRYVEAAWGVGFELEGELKRNKIEEAVRKLMKDAKGVVARERAQELKKKVESCLESGGSSLLAIDKLIGQILSL
ncbi:hypothetical protein QYE76_031910 [Lolium multiflorum]|uniref:Uncharacterized protein n=1 Tax=Lolium multiflorum TaxID=4521 RepID=A0AAD8VHV1_LOLMU|nr:hypothetical protein QYE76_031910 [Lolium multiflorum]